MTYTLDNSVTWSQSFIGDLNPTVYEGDEPALTTANTILALILNPPFTWAFNRATATETLEVGIQDYSVAIPNFGFLEKVSLTLTTGSPAVTEQWELQNVYNTKALGLSQQQGRPDNCAVQFQGALGSPPAPGAIFRFLNLPDQPYVATFVFQEAPNFFTATTQDWNTQGGLPYSFMDIFNSLFLSEMFQFGNDERSVQYRQRGMAALLTKADGLTQMQKNEILGQYLQNDLQTLVNQLKAQQASQARGV
jgi:hypothetical protein